VKKLRRGRLHAWVAAGTVLGSTIVLLLSLSGTASAYYQQFCWGVRVPGKYQSGYKCGSWDGRTQTGLWYITEVGGQGTLHSVCVDVSSEEVPTMCSGGPNQGVYNFYPQALAWVEAQIWNNAYGENVLYGFVDRCDYAECTGP
jgi:hypothetical protein